MECGLVFRDLPHSTKFELLEIVGSTGYGGTFDRSAVDELVDPGLSKLMSTVNWSLHLRLTSEFGGSFSKDAYGIYSEVKERNIKGEKATFFTFLSRFSETLAKMGQLDFGFYFADEWPDREYPRFGSGSIDDLKLALKGSGVWMPIQLNLDTGRLQEAEAEPFYFVLGTSFGASVL